MRVVNVESPRLSEFKAYKGCKSRFSYKILCVQPFFLQSLFFSSSFCSSTQWTAIINGITHISKLQVSRTTTVRTKRVIDRDTFSNLLFKIIRVIPLEAEESLHLHIHIHHHMTRLTHLCTISQWPIISSSSKIYTKVNIQCEVYDSFSIVSYVVINESVGIHILSCA